MKFLSIILQAMGFLSRGWKGYSGAIGLMGMAVYLASQHRYDDAITALFAALGVGGIRHKQDRDASAAAPATLLSIQPDSKPHHSFKPNRHK